MNNQHVTKNNGEVVLYEPQKLIYSLQKAGASMDMANEIVMDISKKLYPYISTKEIYKQSFALLRKKSRPTAARYKLKKAIMELGNTGYPFEKFVGELLAAEGFKTQVGVIVQGKCVSHEVDVIAEKDNLHYMCECKFHQKQARHCDVKIPLYIQSRFKDVEAQCQKKPGHQAKLHQGWIFTNTRFTSDAIQYAECSGLQLVSWDYPKGNAIKERIDKTGVYPITCLTTLTNKEKLSLIDKDVITCKTLCQNPEILTTMNIKETRYKKIMKEAKAVCNQNLDQ